MRCVCGTEDEIDYFSFVTQASRSCGCLRREELAARAIHGESNKGLHVVWSHMLVRCFSEKSKDYLNYGGRGITVCAGWRHDYLAFRLDIGPRPSRKHSLDRIKNELGYWCGHCAECVFLGRPLNCKWSTSSEQTRNKRNNVWVEINGEKKCLYDWCEVLGIGKPAVASRIMRGWDPKKALTTPVMKGWSRQRKKPLV